MAWLAGKLEPCPTCGELVSTGAEECPHCGESFFVRNALGCLGIAVFLKILSIVFAVALAFFFVVKDHGLRW